MKTMLLCVLLLAINGCASAPKFNKISVGMTKGQVIDEIGEPVTTSAKSGVEFLIYQRSLRHSLIHTVTEDYFVKLVNGKVDSYGRKGDFDSTKPPEQTVNINKVERIIHEPAAKE